MLLIIFIVLTILLIHFICYNVITNIPWLVIPVCRGLGKTSLVSPISPSLSGWRHLLPWKATSPSISLRPSLSLVDASALALPTLASQQQVLTQQLLWQALGGREGIRDQNRRGPLSVHLLLLSVSQIPLLR